MEINEDYNILSFITSIALFHPDLYMLTYTLYE